MFKLQGGSNMTRTNCDLFTHKSSRSYLNHLVFLNELLSVCGKFYMLEREVLYKVKYLFLKLK
jgi:hypothetical protein